MAPSLHASETSVPGSYVLGLDMGGTHTDGVILHQGRLVAAVKVLTDHTNLLASTRATLQALFERSPVPASAITRATFGTTLAVNAVVQNACAPVGLMLSAGPGLDPLWSGIGERVALFPGGLDHRGTELRAPTRGEQEALRATVQRWRAEGVQAFACVSKFSPRNPVHEDLMAAIVRDVFADTDLVPVIVTGHRLSGSLNFPRRIASAYWNAAIYALHNRFADAVEASLAAFGINAPAYLLKADGGSIPLTASRSVPVEALLSGPAASVMGILAQAGAVSPVSAREQNDDLLVLDMGGTTTDIALLANGQPLLAPDGLVVQKRSTLVRALQSVSIGLGGDSQIAMQGAQVVVTPRRTGSAMAFGGTQPTFLDCLNVLGHAHAGDVAASSAGVKAFATKNALDAQAVAASALTCARARIAEAVTGLIDAVNRRPVYTLAALLEDRKITPSHAILVGGPAEAVAPLLQETLRMPVTTLPSSSSSSSSLASAGAVANAIGAALTHPTARLELFADTATGVLLVPDLEIRRRIERRYSLAEAQAEACQLLQDRVAAENPTTTDLPPVDVIEAQLFATLDEHGRGGKDIRVHCQLRPGVASMVG
ncbi:MAG: hydantoinase/oxoprolinase family protein [Bilophila sp.]